MYTKQKKFNTLITSQSNILHSTLITHPLEYLFFMKVTVTNKIAQIYFEENLTPMLKTVQDKATKTTNAK